MEDIPLPMWNLDTQQLNGLLCLLCHTQNHTKRRILISRRNGPSTCMTSITIRGWGL